MLSLVNCVYVENSKICAWNVQILLDVAHVVSFSGLKLDGCQDSQKRDSFSVSEWACETIDQPKLGMLCQLLGYISPQLAIIL